MKQLVSPNLSVQGKAGWCLSVAQDVWGVPHYYPTAQDAWNAAQFKHTDRPPTDVATVCYWTYTESGIDYWHIATHLPDGRIYSSPFNVSYGSEWYSSIDAMTARIRKIDPSSQYVGWAEDLSNVRLVTEETMNDKITPSDVDVVRILHSEIGGWNFDATHAGKNDTTLMSACIGADVKTLVRGQWNDKNAQAFRTKRIAAIDFYDNKRPELETKVTDLSKVIAIKDAEIKKLTAQLAVQSNDTELLNGFGAWLTKIIARLGVKG